MKLIRFFFALFVSVIFTVLYAWLKQENATLDFNGLIKVLLEQFGVEAPQFILADQTLLLKQAVIFITFLLTILSIFRTEDARNQAKEIEKQVNCSLNQKELDNVWLLVSEDRSMTSDRSDASEKRKRQRVSEFSALLRKRRVETSPGGNKTAPGSDKTAPGSDKTSSGGDKTSEKRKCQRVSGFLALLRKRRVETSPDGNKTAPDSDKTSSGGDKTSSVAEDLASICDFDSTISISESIDALKRTKDRWASDCLKQMIMPQFSKVTLPLIGFAGTIFGIMGAMKKLKDVIGLGGSIGSKDLANAMMPLIQQIGVAFDTTLIALFGTAILIYRVGSTRTDIAVCLEKACHLVEKKMINSFKLPQLGKTIDDVFGAHRFRRLPQVRRGQGGGAQAGERDYRGQTR